jgi:hypothetical protein
LMGWPLFACYLDTFVTGTSGRRVGLGVDCVSCRSRCRRAVVLGAMRGGCAASVSVGGGWAPGVGVAADRFLPAIWRFVRPAPVDCGSGWG